VKVGRYSPRDLHCDNDSQDGAAVTVPCSACCSHRLNKVPGSHETALLTFTLLLASL
jgi:hypothetical protein